MMVNTEAIIRHALQEGIKITLVVNKIDRLILELRIKPADAYYKIKHTIEEINTFIRFELSSICGFLLMKKSAVKSTQTHNYDSVLKKEMLCLPALT
jgi:translation elongation factor EF-G